MTEFQRIRREVVFDVLDRFPNSGNRTLALKLYKEHPELFKDAEQARSIIRLYKGQSGPVNLHYLKNKKYVKPVQPS